MSQTAEAMIRNRKVICSRCGANMQPEEFWSEDTEMVPFLFWRCQTGHITQAVPLPADVVEKALRTPFPAL